MKRRYQLQRRRGLRFTRCAIHGPAGVAVIEVLVDTGATFSLLPPDALRRVGLDPAQSGARQQIFTVNGYAVTPVVTVSRFECLGQRGDQFPVLAHALPFGSSINGVVSMDFLARFPFRFELDLGVIVER